LPLVCCCGGVVGVRCAECLLVRASLINGADLWVSGAQVVGCDLERLFGVGGARGKVELDGAVLAGSVAVASVAVAGESHAHGGGGGERDEAEAVRDELVVEDGGVGLDFNKVDGDGGHLSDHDTAEGVGHARVGVAELELGVVVLELADPHAGEALVRRGGCRTVHLGRAVAARGDLGFPLGSKQIWGQMSRRGILILTESGCCVCRTPIVILLSYFSTL
jgi:hypothetical protein